MGSVLVVAASLLVFVFIKEPKEYEAAEKEPGMIESLKVVWQEQDKSALRLFLAIFFWFIGYAAIEAFFNLYAINHLGLTEANGTRLLGQLSLIFVVFALPAGYIGAAIGRRVTIVIGILIMSIVITVIFFLPVAALLARVSPLPVIGVSLEEGGPRSLIVMGVLLMIAGAGWAFININSLPMVVDMTDASRIGTYTGLYYLFSTLSAIAGPNINGQLVQLTGNNYNNIMIAAPIFLIIALVLMLGVKRGEAVPAEAVPIGD